MTPSLARQADGRSAGAAGGGQLQASSRQGEPVIDDDMAEIEAILRKRGIT